jgi:Cu+-exporting ATPase
MANKPKDPVCGMEVDPAQGRAEKTGEHEFYFCSEDCRRKFKADPVQYTGGEGTA